jgi:hypothetical protein
MAAVMATIFSSRWLRRPGRRRTPWCSGRAAAGALVLLAGDDVELDHAMVFVGAAFGRGIALALLGDGVDQHRAVVAVADVLEDLDQAEDVMAVDRADVIEAELLEQGAAGHHAAGIFLEPLGRVAHRRGSLAGERRRACAG